ncbi:hypothetical protein HZS_7973, partial [Henneguya salminicola]
MMDEQTGNMLTTNFKDNCDNFADEVENYIINRENKEHESNISIFNTTITVGALIFPSLEGTVYHQNSNSATTILKHCLILAIVFGTIKIFIQLFNVIRIIMYMEIATHCLTYIIQFIGIVKVTFYICGDKKRLKNFKDLNFGTGIYLLWASNIISLLCLAILIRYNTVKAAKFPNSSLPYRRSNPQRIGSL